MQTYRVQIIGLFDSVVFRWEGQAKEKYHAFKIAGAVFDGPFKRCELVEIVSKEV